MTRLYSGFMNIMLTLPELMGVSVSQDLWDILKQVPLITFECYNIVSALVNDRLVSVCLGTHRINCHNAAMDI